MLNKWLGIGRLTSDPERKDVGSGKVKTTFAIAVNRKYKDHSGELQEEVTYVPIVCWGSLAENVAKYQTKGKRVYVEGRLRIDSFENAEGERKKVVEVSAYSVLFLDSREDSERAKPVYSGNAPYGGNEEVPF